MRPIVFATVLGVFGSGCGAELKEQHDQKIAQVISTCTEAVLDPATTEVADSVVVDAPKICGTTPNEEECQKAVIDVFVARLTLRYAKSYADFSEVEAEQRAYFIGDIPIAKRMAWTETWTRKSHNDHLATKCAEMKNQVDANYARAEAERRANVQRALQGAAQGFAQGMQSVPRPVNCTSNTVGANTFTNCN
jgi:hypothetical protein